MDARHHPFDVITGSMLGAAVAFGAYRQYFPPVSETWHKGRAYPVRTWGKPLKQPPLEVRFEDGAEPLRSSARNMPAGGDEEQSAAGASTGSSSNVFREQIRQTRRMHESERGTHRLRDGNFEDSSEESEEEGRAEAYELQPRYVLTDPEGRQSAPG
jgi:diacylglycerol diphosphate phosphatase/phosphatidate phosphatase